jgi:hypothetical protein
LIDDINFGLDSNRDYGVGKTYGGFSVGSFVKEDGDSVGWSDWAASGEDLGQLNGYGPNEFS